MAKRINLSLRNIGPGIVIAATGLGAGDLIAASVAGAQYGTAIIWAVIFGALIKFALNEGIARWQLVTGTTLPEAWVSHMPRFISVYFLIYLVIWSFIVAGALIAACGLAAHTLLPALSIKQWGVIHSIAAVLLVLYGRYQWLENTMKGLMALMFIVVLTCAVLISPDLKSIFGNLIHPGIPDGSSVFILGIIGGIGGSITLLSYGYWMREKSWVNIGDLRACRIDLAVAYGLTGFFGIAIMIIAASAQPEISSGSRMLIGLADSLNDLIGPQGRWLFLTGFWAAVFTSMLGVWHGIPYLFADFMQSFRKRHFDITPSGDIARTSWYRGYLFYLSLPPMLLLLTDKPLWVVIAYTITGAFFMPMLATLLLYMNNQRRWISVQKNGWLMNMLLSCSLLLFCLLLITELQSRF